MSTTVYIAGILLQALAGMIALWQVRSAPRKLPWLLIAVSALLIVWRRAATLSQFMKADRDLAAAEVITLVVSALFFIGVVLMSRMFRDVMKAHADIREKEALLRFAGETVQFGSWSVNVRDQRVVWSDEVRRIHEVAPGSSPTVEEGIHFYAPEWREEITGIFEACVREGKPYDEEMEIITARGNRVWVRTSGEAVRDASGAIIGVQGSFQNINARKRQEEALRLSEERLRLAHKATTDVVWDWDIVNDAQQWNESGTATFGWTEIVEHPVTAAWWVERVHPQDLQRVEEGFFAVVDDPAKSYWQEEYRFRKADGSFADVMDRGYVMRDEQGKALRMVGAMRDISEFKRHEEEIIRYKKSESLGCMAGAIAHHYNNLMGAVLGNLELALESATDRPLAAGMVTEAMAAARRAAEVSRLMLAYLGQAQGKRELVDLAVVCRAAVANLSTSLPVNARIQTSFPPRVPVHADAAQMQQVLINLVTNAGEALAPGEGDIAVTLAEVSAASIPAPGVVPAGWTPRAERYVCLSVSDTAGSLSPEVMEKLFDPFFTTRFTGRGLGLPVALGIVKAHEGCLAVESTPGVGSCFRVFIPLAGTPETLPGPPVQQPRSELEGVTVLLIEDEATVRRMAVTMLTRLGMTVIEAGNGAEALAVFQQRGDEIRCAVCDLTMPRMNGWETLAALRALRPGLPVILTSGYDRAYAMDGEYSEQPQVFLGKPYRMADLKEALAKALAGDAVA